MHQTLCRISRGEGREEDLELLEEIGETLKVASLCALGQTAANPVLSTIRYFREEYLEHIRKGACPAGVCRDLLAYRIDPEICTGCGKCRRACPSEAIRGEKKQPHLIEPEKCLACGVCYEQCAFNAVERKSPRGEYR
jgi:NAD-dependent dihydropyrimidine dehydrogenase PreA subunit